MSKPALRFLSLGFLVSALILAGYRSFFYEPQSAVATDTSTELTQEDETYKEKYENLLAETELAKMESENAIDEQNAESTEESTESEAEETSTSEEDSSSQVTTATIVINEGDPSSLAARQLQDQGIIEDSVEFDNFLEDNSLSNLVRPGTFTIESGMSFQEIADILSSEN